MSQMEQDVELERPRGHARIVYLGPVAPHWDVRSDFGDRAMIDWQWPAPEPPPVTTIAWRLAHIAIPVFGIRASAHFGDGSLTIATAAWPATGRSASAITRSPI